MSSKRIAAPDATHSAVIEEVDNGLGFGLGALVHEIHIVKNADEIRTHGDRSDTLVFYADTTEYKGIPVTADWQSGRTLRVTYSASLRPGKRLDRLGDVAVVYVVQ